MYETQVSIEDLERKLIKLETACGPPLNLIMLQVLEPLKHENINDYIRWSFKVVWQPLSMLDLCKLWRFS